jgi:hypothetical protein
MADVVRAVMIEIDSLNPQDSLDQALSTLNIDGEDFLAATTIALEERNNKAKVVIFFSETIN